VTFVDIFSDVDVIIGQSVIDGISKNKSTVNWTIFLSDDWISGQFFGLCLFYKKKKKRKLKNKKWRREMAVEKKGHYVNTSYLKQTEEVVQERETRRR
jgi:hypothetical protein